MLAGHPSREQYLRFYPRQRRGFRAHFVHVAFCTVQYSFEEHSNPLRSEKGC